jgi:hypothetical protein
MITILVMDCFSRRIGTVLLLVLFLAGCAVESDVAEVRLDLTGVAVSSDVSDLSAVLSKVVDAKGRLIPAGFASVRDRLDSQLKKMAISGPTATPEMYPTDESRWAYWYNARAAWSMKLADLAGFPPAQCQPRAREKIFLLDGCDMSLEKIDSTLQDEARRSGDFRLAACAPGAWADYASLPQKPFTEGNFSAGLSKAFNRLVLNEKRFVIDVDNRRVCIPPMLWACRDMVFARYRRRFGPCKVSLTTALSPYLARPARYRLKNALGYAVVRQKTRTEIIITRRKIFYPGSIGRIEQ